MKLRLSLSGPLGDTMAAVRAASAGPTLAAGVLAMTQGRGRAADEVDHRPHTDHNDHRSGPVRAE